MNNNLNKGYVSMIMVLIITTISVVLITSVIQSGITNSRTAIILEVGEQAWLNAESCGEEGLEQIRQNTSFTGSFTQTLPVGSCSGVVSGIGVTKTIATTGIAGDNTRALEVTTSSLSPVITIANWQES